MIEDVLLDEGHTVAVARNGAVALALLDQLERPSLILLDIWMPVMDGLGFLNALRNRKDREDFEVVVMSAAVAPEWFVHAPRVIRAMKKPFDVSELLSLSADFAARRTAGGASAATAGQQGAG